MAVYYGHGLVFGRGCHEKADPASEEGSHQQHSDETGYSTPDGMTLFAQYEDELILRWDLAVFDHIRLATLGVAALDDRFDALRDEAETLGTEVVFVHLRRTAGSWSCDFLASGAEG